MISKDLGKTGVQIPEVGIGTWHYHAGPEPLRKGLAGGALFIDTAESYGTEPVVAEAIAGKRDSVFLATKVSPENFRRAGVLKSADRSLRQLGTDYIDLYQLHRPNSEIPLEETLGALEELADLGKIRFIGVSNFSVAQLQCAQRAVRKHPIVSNQVRYNLVDRTITSDLLPYCQANQITVLAYSPLARGLQHILDCDPQLTLQTMARCTGRSVAQIALNWCLCQPGVVVIPKGNSVEHIMENCGASDWRLSPEQLRQLDEHIAFRQRGGFENLLRQFLPPSVKRGIQQTIKFLPSSVRRRIN
jgi:diketogulonate reductase-like aldo/keto reductase